MFLIGICFYTYTFLYWIWCRCYSVTRYYRLKIRTWFEVVSNLIEIIFFTVIKKRLKPGFHNEISCYQFVLCMYICCNSNSIFRFRYYGLNGIIIDYYYSHISTINICRILDINICLSILAWQYRILSKSF